MKKKILIFVLCGIVIVGSIVLLVLNFNTQKPQKFKAFADYSSYYHGDFKKAFKEVLPIAKAGDPGAQVFIANLCSSGLGVNVNNKQAFYWYTKAEEQNSAAGCVGLGVMYRNGTYVKQNDKKAVELYKRAIAINNSAGAKCNLALMYLSGVNGKKNYKEGLKFLNGAANQNYSAAQSELGAIFYSGGFGEQVNYSKALSLTLKAAKNGEPVAQKNLALIYYDGLAAKKDYTKAYMWSYIAQNYGNVQVSKPILDSIISKLSAQEKANAERQAKEWMKTHKEINFTFVNRK